MVYRIEYSPEAEEHFRQLTKRQQTIVLDKVIEQLTFEPNVETRNRKLLRPNVLAPWELRIGIVRIFYDIWVEPEPAVLIRAIGTKLGNRLFIGSEEVTP